MTRQQFEEVFDALVDIVDAWNDAAADDDRGRGNDAIVLIIHDDGSGWLGRTMGLLSEVERLHQFDNGVSLSAILEGHGMEFEGDKS